MKKGNKRGLSPVVATSLLIGIGVILVVIIIIWAISFVGEEIVKGEGDNREAIKNWCDETGISVDVVKGEGKIVIQNTANVPIFGVEIKKKGAGSVDSLGSIIFQDDGTTISSGQTKEKILPAEIDNEISVDDQLLVIPVLVGLLKDQPTAYTCDDKNGVDVTVIN